MSLFVSLSVQVSVSLSVCGGGAANEHKRRSEHSAEEQHSFLHMGSEDLTQL